MSLDEALSMYAEAAQDLASAGMSNAAGLHYNAVDLANHAAEMTLQALYALDHDSRAPYDHNLRTLGTLVSAPAEVLADLDTLTPYHPSIYLEQVEAEMADDEVGGDAADAALKAARRVMKWARPTLLG
jgi:HEPN domain-containing protein